MKNIEYKTETDYDSDCYILYDNGNRVIEEAVSVYNKAKNRHNHAEVLQAVSQRVFDEAKVIRICCIDPCVGSDLFRKRDGTRWLIVYTSEAEYEKDAYENDSLSFGIPDDIEGILEELGKSDLDGIVMNPSNEDLRFFLPQKMIKRVLKYAGRIR